MKITVAGHGFDVGSSLANYAEESLLGIVHKYFSQALSARISFHKEGKLFHTDIIVNEGINHSPVIKVTAESRDAYMSLDTAVSRIAAKLRRYKSRMKDHKPSRFNMKSSIHKEEQDEGNIRAVQVREERVQLRHLSLEDAIMHMDLTSAPALVFINLETNRLNIIHKEGSGDLIVLLDTDQSFKTEC